MPWFWPWSSRSRIQPTLVQARERCDAASERSSRRLGAAEKHRTLFVNEVESTHALAAGSSMVLYGNAIRTAKYTLLNFVPKSLLEQFRRVANCYFLVISLLQLTTSLSPTNEYSTIGPLLVVLLVTMVKEGLEDRHRHQMDYEQNNRPTLVLKASAMGPPPPKSKLASHASARNTSQKVLDTSLPSDKEYELRTWESIEVGHVVKVRNDEPVPADLVLLFTSSEDDKAIVETSGLDGESSLKIRRCVTWGSTRPNCSRDFGTRVRAEMRYEQPNKQIYSFEGTLSVTELSERSPSSDSSSPYTSTASFHTQGLSTVNNDLAVTIGNVLLRGMTLKNTAWAVGVVVAAGNDTKLMQNAKPVPSKFSRMDRVTNRCVFILFVILFTICTKHAVDSLGVSRDVYAEAKVASFMPFVQPPSWKFFGEVWITFLILYNNMIPISLYISLEVIKWYQARHIEADKDLHCPKTGHRAVARTSNINEDLGLIKYVFSDKTGTLTKNRMLFSHCSIGGIVFDGTEMNVRNGAHSNSSRDVSNSPRTSSARVPRSVEPFDMNITEEKLPAGRQRSQLLTLDVRNYRELLRLVLSTAGLSAQEITAKRLALPFFRCILLCHSVTTVIAEESCTNENRRNGSVEEGHSLKGSDVNYSEKSTPLAAVKEEKSIDRDDQTARPKATYCGTSPDEVALLDAAREFDCIYDGKCGDLVTIRVFGQKEIYRLLAVNEFDSARKCMSVVVQLQQSKQSNALDEQEEGVLVFVKGADNVMFANAASKLEVSQLAPHVHHFATRALRTLIFGCRKLSMRDFDLWKQEMDICKRALEDREGKIVATAKQIETSIQLLGATGVEDLLQDNVKESIEKLCQGGMSVWMLTGDKDETAISVGQMCGLVSDKSKMIMVKGKTKQACLDEISTARKNMKKEGAWEPGYTRSHVSLVINGSALDLLLSDEALPEFGRIPVSRPHGTPRNSSEFGNERMLLETFLRDDTAKKTSQVFVKPESVTSVSTGRAKLIHRSSNTNSRRSAQFSSGIEGREVHKISSSTQHFLDLATQCSTIVACRLSPMQKAQIVALVKSASGKPVTLAIGDGGNDVSMIQEADVGIGVYGHEGMQAIRAADFALANFAHLPRLLLIHGRWNANRLATVILFTFYKNFTLIMVLISYTTVNLRSGQTLFESYLMAGWNVIYTVLPILVLGIYDQDVRPETALAFPFSYRTNLQHGNLTMWRFFGWMVSGFLHSCTVAFMFLVGSFRYINLSNGSERGLLADGAVVYGAVLVTVTLKAAMAMQPIFRWTYFHYFSLIGGLIFYIVFIMFYTRLYAVIPSFSALQDLYGVCESLLWQPSFWLSIIVSSMSALIPDSVFLYLQKMYLPSSNDIVREIDAGLASTRNLELPSSSHSASETKVATNQKATDMESRDSSKRRRGSVVAPSGRPNFSMIDHEWKSRFCDFKSPSEHDELSSQFTELQRDLASQLGLPDPLHNEDDFSGPGVVKEPPRIHPFTLEFMGEQNQSLEREYQFAFALRERSRVKYILKMCLVLVPLYALYEVYWEKETGYIYVRISYVVATVVCMRVVNFYRFIIYYNALVVGCMAIIGMALTLTISDTGKFATALYPVVVFVVIRIKFLYALLLSLYNALFFFGATAAISTPLEIANVRIDHWLDSFFFMLYLAFTITYSATACYSLQHTMRLEFLQNRTLLFEQRRSTRIIKNMMPEHVVKRMQQGDTLISDEEKDVTILFCDIADFGSFFSRFTPTEVVSLLDRIYSLFDLMCIKHGVRKMETVSKTYMACAGLQGELSGKEAALRVVALANEMLDTIALCKASNSNGVKIRIGVHSGRVISGLVGLKKQQFSLFGDTVNTASRMQSTGVAGRCQVSKDTYLKLAKYFSFEERMVEAKGKGHLTVYLLGEPQTVIAHVACAGRLESVTKRGSLSTTDRGPCQNIAFHDVSERHSSRFDSGRKDSKVENMEKEAWSLRSVVKVLIFGRRSDLASEFSIESYGTDVEETVKEETKSILLTFKDPILEEEFVEERRAGRMDGARKTILALTCYTVLMIVRDIVMDYVKHSVVDAASAHSKSELALGRTTLLISYGIIICIYLPTWKCLKIELATKWEGKLPYMLLVLYFVGLLAGNYSSGFLWWRDYMANEDTSLAYTDMCLDAVLMIMVVSNGGSLLHRHALLSNLVLYASTAATCLVMLREYPQDYAIFNSNFKQPYPLLLLTVSVLTNVIGTSSVSFFKRRQFWLMKRTKLETETADQLIYRMLPAAVVMRLKEGETVCDQHHQVGILFSDIRGFTSMASKADTAEVVSILASLFSAFDKLTDKHGVFKMQTIGDAYVIASGLPYLDITMKSPVFPAPMIGSGSTASIPGSSVRSSRVTSSRVRPWTSSVANSLLEADLNDTRPSSPTDDVEEQLDLRATAGVIRSIARLTQRRNSELGKPENDPFSGSSSGRKVEFTRDPSFRGQSLTRRNTLQEKGKMTCRNHIRDLLGMARDMHRVVEKVRDPITGEKLQMRIGIHVGSIIGGVIGTSTLRYDMWGHDALTANELETNSLPGHTLVSSVVASIVRDMPDIKCTFHKKVDFTNVKNMDTYLVEMADTQSILESYDKSWTGNEVDSAE